MTAWFNLPIAALAVAVEWPHLSAPFAFGWLAAVAFVLLWRTAMANGPAPVTRAGWQHRLHAAALGAAVSGGLWGVFILVMHFTGSDTYAGHVFLGFLAAGLTAGGLSSLGWYLPAYLGYLGAIMIPLAVSYGLHFALDTTVMGVLTLFYSVVMISTARAYHGSILATLRLRRDVARLGQDLSIARERIENAEQARVETLAQLSHELRTPLNAVIGFAELLAMEPRGPLGHAAYTDYVGKIQGSGKDAHRLVEAILDFARAEAGRLPLEPQAVDVPALIEEVVSIMAPVALARGVQLAIEPVEGPLLVSADPARLRQVLFSLLTNAVKFTDEGGIVRILLAPEPDRTVRISVSDTGCGMSAAEIPLALTPFVRLENSLVHKSGGIGLGLPLAKRLVEASGGAFDLVSVKGHGTTVTLKLPGADAVGEAEPATPFAFLKAGLQGVPGL